MQPSPDALRRRWRDDPQGRVVAEAYCLLLTLVFHDGNSHGRKLLTILVVLVWGVLEVGAGFGVARLPDQFVFIRVVVGVLLGRMWGIEINNFAGIEFQFDDSGGDGESQSGDDGDGGGGGADG